MIPSRGLPPRQLSSLAARQTSALRSATSRKFSSVPRTSTFSAPSCRTNSLRATNWRAGANSTTKAALSSSAVRHGSWYVPWSWGKSNTPANTTSPEPTPELVPEPTAEPVVTTATPELQPAGIEQPAGATANSSHSLNDGTSIEDLLEKVADAPPADPSFIDPSVPISYWGNLKDLGMDYGWGPSAFFESILELVYVNGELGWAASIVASGIILRVGLFFTFQRMGSDANAKMVAMKPLLQPLQDQMEDAKRQGDDDRVQMLKMKQQGIMKDVGADLFKTFGTGVAQAVFGYGAWRTLRGISSLPAPGLSTDGWAWFTDLTVADPYYILPLATGGILYMTLKKGGETGLQDQTAQTSMQKNVIMIFPAMMTMMTSWQPAAVQLYFLTTGMTGYVTARLLKMESVRRFLRIRLLPSPESNKLYSKILAGDVELSQVKDTHGKMRYQKPNAPAPKTRTFASSVNLKSGARLPAHLKVPEPEVKAEAPKSAWERLKAAPKDLGKKIEKWQDPRDPGVKRRQDARLKQKQALAKYEKERNRSLKGQ
ncbi:hypothetical protein BU23DRAFT_516560 [Bimuria novae-zelandiae CBS 107.79]|uniref:Membrane insertase YidC/Oxa/ALB C-terminal domain-containing protein n=1 Tax=Bimuria novae-zelandiae CBS 107.79 TaxID=1447943 RepID=A0A6A5UQW2_9PLEO|nr:hypothetical protein BU23DRAFT_516560 [Bimuria novae-zelandiae CBS 107.79]